jgi:hypothetical protein
MPGQCSQAVSVREVFSAYFPVSSLSDILALFIKFVSEKCLARTLDTNSVLNRL